MSVPQIEMVLAIIILSVLVILMAIQCTEECGLGAHELPCKFSINCSMPGNNKIIIYIYIYFKLVHS